MGYLGRMTFSLKEVTADNRKTALENISPESDAKFQKMLNIKDIQRK